MLPARYFNFIDCKLEDMLDVAVISTTAQATYLLNLETRKTVSFEVFAVPDRNQVRKVKGKRPPGLTRLRPG